MTRTSQSSASIYTPRFDSGFGLDLVLCVRVSDQCCDDSPLCSGVSQNNADGTGLYWDDPRKVGMEVTEPDGTRYFRGPGLGTNVYLTHLRARSRDFIKGGDAIFLLSMEGKRWTQTHHYVHAVPRTIC